MDKVLRKDVGIYYYYKGKEKISGAPSDVCGDLSGVRGDLSGVSGNVDEAHITDEERKAGINISDLIIEDNL